MIIVNALCNNCGSGHRVYHLEWTALICQHCGKNIDNDFEVSGRSHPQTVLDDGDRGWSDELHENEEFAQDGDFANSSPSDLE